MQRLERVLPPPAIDEIVPFGDQIDDGTAGIPLAKWHTAVHAARALDFELVFRNRLVHLFPIEHAQLDRLSLPALPGIFHETLRITHPPTPLPFPFPSS